MSLLVIKERSYDRQSCIPFDTLDIYSVDVAESCVYLSNYVIYFLSRLRGGERISLYGDYCPYFLSRLRGGEQILH